MATDKIGNIVSNHPKGTIILTILIVIAAIGCIQIFGIEQEFSEDSFMPEMDVVQASNEISEKYAASYSVSMLVKSKNNDLLTSQGLVEMLQIENKMISDEKIIPMLENSNPPSANVNSVADIIAQMTLAQTGNLQPTMEEKILTLQNMDDSQIKQTITGLLTSDQTPPEVKGAFTFMLTKDFDPTTGNIKAKGTIIMVSLKPESAIEETTEELLTIPEIEQKMDKIVKETELETIEVTVLGESIISDEITKVSMESMQILLPIALLLVIVILIIIYRNLFDLSISLLALIFTIIWVYGFGSALGFTFNPMTIAVPVLIVGLGIDYGIHITMRYREETKNTNDVKKATNITIRSVGMALLLATITTVVAFLSNLASPITLLAEFGVLCAIGIIGSFFTMTTFVPACKQLRDIRKLKKGKSINNKAKKTGKLKSTGVAVLDKAMSSGAVAAEHHPKIVIIIVLLITLGTGVGALQLDTTFNFEDFLPEDLEISQDISYMTEEFAISGGQAQQANILIKGDITNPQLLNKIDQTIDNMKDDETVIINEQQPEVQSILSIMKDWATNSSGLGVTDPAYSNEFEVQYNQIMNIDGTPRTEAIKNDIKQLYDWFYANPETTKAITTILHRNPSGDYEGTLLRISVNIDATDNEGIDKLEKELNQDKKPLDGTAETTVTGSMIVTKTVMDSLNESQMGSLIITIILSFIILTIVFWINGRSIVLGAITITPLIFCVTWTLGTMYLLGISLNIMTIMITSLTIGLGITYGIHITHRFLEDLKKYNNHDKQENIYVQCPNCGKIKKVTGKPGQIINVTCEECQEMGKVTIKKPERNYVHEACRSTVSHTGTALFGAAATTIAGFGILVFALMPPLQQFGGITALTILYSFLASVFILPTFLTIWAKRKQKKTK